MLLKKRANFWKAPRSATLYLLKVSQTVYFKNIAITINCIRYLNITMRSWTKGSKKKQKSLDYFPVFHRLAKDKGKANGNKYK